MLKDVFLDWVPRNYLHKVYWGVLSNKPSWKWGKQDWVEWEADLRHDFIVGFCRPIGCFRTGKALQSHSEVSQCSQNFTTGQSVIGLGPQSDVTSPKQFLAAEYNFQWEAKPWAVSSHSPRSRHLSRLPQYLSQVVISKRERDTNDFYFSHSTLRMYFDTLLFSV